MSDEAFSYEEYENVRGKLVKTIHGNLTDKDKAFLLSIKNLTPDWKTYDFKRFPAIAWKLQNLQKLKDKNADKHREQYEALERKLSDLKE